jgi:hypothetical protein
VSGEQLHVANNGGIGWAIESQWGPKCIDGCCDYSNVTSNVLEVVKRNYILEKFPAFQTAVG